MKDDADMPTSLAEVEQEIGQEWIFVQSGLFNYPLADGEAPALLANRCRHCSTSFFPKRTICPYCVRQDFENITLGKRGVIYASTMVYIDSSVGINAPYAFGYVDIPENKVRVFALFTGDDPSSFLPGSEVELVLGPVGKNDAGKKVIGYMFKRVLG
ncbi:MAG: OB-fold domain-containing protein [Deltaproteobacteria bacterium]|nr:OB-fold domain-containing protein [Deltaproteobacteria bacterium]